MAVKLNQSEKDLIKDRSFMRRVAHGYEMQIAPGVWLKGAFLAQGQDRFIVDAARLGAGIEAALGSLSSQDDANFAAAALLRLKMAGVDIDGAQLRQALAGSAYALTLLAALDADVTDFADVKWLQTGGYAGADAGTDAAFLLGSGGADRLVGASGADTLAGNGGSDTLEGGAGGDTYLFSAGDGSDIIHEASNGADAIDTIRFGTGITPAMIGFSRAGQDLVLRFEGSTDQITIAGWGTADANRIERFEFADGTVWDADVLAEFVWASGPVGTDGDDTLQAWNIGEWLEGGEGDDILIGGSQYDLLDGGSGNDIIEGGGGNDQLVGGDGLDTYRFARGDGRDTIIDYDSKGEFGTIVFGPGIAESDLVIGRSGTSVVIGIKDSSDRLTVRGWIANGTNGIGRLEFADGAAWDAARLRALVDALPILGTGGVDYLFGDNAGNTLIGGAGDDILAGGEGDDVYQFARGDGNDTIHENDYDSPANQDTIRFGAGITADDIGIVRRGAGLVFTIKGGNDSITVANWTFGSEYRIERIEFADGSAWEGDELRTRIDQLSYRGGDGDDYLTGDADANILAGRRGNDELQGGAGGDTYLFERGDGQDRIGESGYDTDTIRFGAGIAAGDVVLIRSGADLVFALAGGEDRITVRDWSHGDYYRIEQVAFADGTVWDAAALAAMVAALPVAGTAGDDLLYGDDSANIFNGGTGNDTLYGGDGGDTYLFQRGDGHDTIQEWVWYNPSTDTIRFGEGIAAADLVLRRSAAGITFKIADGDDSVTVLWANNGSQVGIEQVAFADGTVWDAAALANMVALLPLLGTDGDDYLGGDTGDNTFDGGAGNDHFQGGGGGDTYLFKRGDGQDIIEEYGYDADTIRFGAGISAADVVLARSGDDLVFALAGTDDRITVRNWRSGDFYRIEQVAFADGTVWNAAALGDMIAAIPIVGTDGDDVLSGDDGANTFDGGAGNDILQGGYGSDSYLFQRGDGQDIIDEFGYDADTIRFGAGVRAEDIVLSRSGDNLVFAVAGSDERITARNWYYGDYYRIEQVAFADGTVWDAAVLAGLVAAIPVTGTAGDDYLMGDGGANTFDGGAGNDTLQGGYGGDTYLFERGDGQDSIVEGGYDADTIRFGVGIAAGDIVLSRSGNDLAFALAGTADRITVRNWRYGDFYRIEQVAFADGTVWNAAALAAMIAAVPIVGTDGDDFLVGDDNANTIDGGAGNDILQGGHGNDAYLFERGDGQDSIEEWSYGDADTIRFGAGIAAGDIVLSRSGGDLVLAIAGSDDRVTVRNWHYGEYYRIEQVTFADGTVWDAAALAAMIAAIPLVGTAEDDVLEGDEGANTFYGGTGNDTLWGGDGGDTYLFERGDGQDSIEEAGNGQADTIRFGAGIAAADIVVSREGSDLVLAIAGSDDRVTVRNWRYGDYYRIEQVAFADGTVWDAAALKALAAVTVTGTDGDDYLAGGDDDDLFDGGAGNDTLHGGDGGDTYLFERGDGRDSISDAGSGVDTIRFGTGIASADIVVSREGSDLVFAVAGTNDRVTVRNWGYDSYYRIEQVAFADGTVWDAAALKGLAAVPVIGTDGDDYLSGDRDDNLFDGGAGNDILRGGYGSDSYLFERGDGQDTINEEGADVDTIRFGAGIGAGDIVLSRSGDDLVFAIAGSDDRITVRNWRYGDYYRIEQVAFADGTLWDAAALKARANIPYIGTDGDDYLSGDGDDNLLDGGAGNDALLGSYGADTYLFDLGDGQDSIGESGLDSDTIRFGAGIGAADIVVSREGSGVVFAVAGTEDRIAVSNWQYGAHYRVERIEFADGTAWDAAQLDSMVAGLPFAGTGRDDNLYGDDLDNVLVGGAGNDYLNGGDGGDTYLFQRGDGHDLVMDTGYDPTRPDVIRFGEGILEDDVSVMYSGSSLVFSMNGGDDRVEVMNWQYGEIYRIERIEFADGSSWDAATIEGRVGAGEAREAGPGAWTLSSSMLDFHLHSGSGAALVGDSGLQYGGSGLAAYPQGGAQALLATPELGADRQAVSKAGTF